MIIEVSMQANGSSSTQVQPVRQMSMTVEIKGKAGAAVGKRKK